MGKLNEFDDLTIQDLFGYEDAESEPIERLKEYYLKSPTYKRVTSDLPLRIIVGHKGTGKSALIKMASSEEIDKGNLPILIKPDDIAELGSSDENFLLKIKQWKYGLTKIIGEKVLTEFGIFEDDLKNQLSKFGIKLITFFAETISSVGKKINLQPSEKIAVDNFLRTKKVVVYIDDLDRGWQGKKDDVSRISALLNAVRDLANDNPGLIFKIALRTDVYYLVRTSDESTDKIEGTVIWFNWTNQEILVMLIKRILSFFNESFDENILLKTPQKHLAHYMHRIFEEKFEGSGKWENVQMYRVLMSMIRKRPRDLVKLCSQAAHEAQKDNSKKICTRHLISIFEEYSQGRIQDTINEYKSELPNIEKLIFGMKPTKKEKIASDAYVFTTQDLHLKLNKLISSSVLKFANNKPTNAKELANFLYKINFLTARKILDTGEIQRKYFEESRYLSSSMVDFGYDWEIHPAFRWALQPDDINTIFHTMIPSATES